MPRLSHPVRGPWRHGGATARAALALATAAPVACVSPERSYRQSPDGTRFGFSMREFSSEGPGGSVDVAFGDAPAPAGARERLRATEPAGLRVVLTRWAPADVRPAAYPGGLPFLPGREVHTAEHVPGRLTRPAEYAGAVGRAARWTASTQAACDSTRAQLAAAGEAEGWRRDSAATARLGPDAVGYARAGWTRTVMSGRVEEPPIAGVRPGSAWCFVDAADRPAGGDMPGVPHLSWPHWWDPTWVGPPPPPALVRRVRR